MVENTPPLSRTRRALTTRILAALLLMAIPAAASEKSPNKFDASKSYDLGSLVELGLALNPSTRAAFARAEAARASLGEERAPYYPRLSAGFRTGWDQWYTPATAAPDYFTRRQNTAVLSL